MNQPPDPQLSLFENLTPREIARMVGADEGATLREIALAEAVEQLELDLIAASDENARLIEEMQDRTGGAA